MTTKKIDTLVEDIYALFDPDSDHKPSEENLEYLFNGIRQVFERRLAKQDERSAALRFSALGKPDRQIWYSAHPDGKEENLSPKTYFKFLYGDLLEVIALFLAKEAGHTVEDEQKEVNVDGVLGHIDCKIDGVLVDVKSANQHAFKKFENGDIYEDIFLSQYIGQLCGYSNVETPGQAPAFFAIDKTVGGLCVTHVPTHVADEFKPAPRIEHLKEVIASDEPPPRCYEDEPDGKSGNRKLGTGCSYCGHKFRCWSDLRVFLYSNGPRYLTKVVKTPDVFEVKREG